jgi:hypothetical protein
MFYFRRSSRAAIERFPLAAGVSLDDLNDTAGQFPSSRAYIDNVCD